MSSDLLLASFKNTKPFIPPITFAKVVKVFDGDSVTVAACLFGTIHRFSIRLLGIDTPEIHAHCPFEHTRAVVVRDHLHHLLFDKFVRVKIVDNDKYGGRYLGYLWSIPTKLCINKYMVDNNFAVRYDGQKKCKWTEAMCQGDFSECNKPCDIKYPDWPVLSDSDSPLCHELCADE